jgi:lipid-A-disaccharide synthase
LECAYFGVLTVALYKTSLWTYWIGRRVVTVKYLAMPNLLANEPIYPEFIQHQATAANIAGAALELLGDPARRQEIQSKLARVISTLGGPGAAQRAAAAVLKLTDAGYNQS